MSLTPLQFADVCRDRFFRPAVDALSGQDRRLQRGEARRANELPGELPLAGSELERYFRVTGYRSSSNARVVEAAHERALAAGNAAADADGTIRNAERLPVELRPIFQALLPSPAPSAEFSPRVLRRVMDAYGIEDERALIEEALARHNHGSPRLTRAELEAAAKVLTRDSVAIGIISDLDKTIIPPHDQELPLNAYPGVARLFAELEALAPEREDTTYVTARHGSRLDGVAEWLATHGLPNGPIEGGVSGFPAAAENEKIADITRLMEADPGRRFVLFGDSNHRDPEVYRAIRGRFGERVIAAFIHRVSEVDRARVEGLHLIHNYAEAASILLGLGVLDRDAAQRVMVAAQLEGLDITDAEIRALLGDR